MWLLNIAEDWIDDISKLDKRTNNDLWGMCQEVVIALCESSTDDICLEGLRKITRNLHQGNHTYFEPTKHSLYRHKQRFHCNWMNQVPYTFEWFVLCSLFCYVVSLINSRVSYFYVLLTVHRGIIFENNQPDAQFFFMYVYFYSLHISGSRVPIIRRINFINTTSGIRVCHSV